MTRELKEAIQMEKRILAEYQKTHRRSGKVTDIDKVAQAMIDWGDLAMPYVQYCKEHPQISNEAWSVLADIDKKIAAVKQRSERTVASSAELKRLQDKRELLEKENKKKTKVWFAIGFPIMLLLTALVYWLVGSYVGVYLHELRNIWDLQAYFVITPGGVILLVPFAFLIGYLVAAGRLNNRVTALQDEYDRQEAWIRQQAESAAAEEIKCLEESKEPYENVIKAVKHGGVFYYMQEL